MRSLRGAYYAVGLAALTVCLAWGVVGCSASREAAKLDREAMLASNAEYELLVAQVKLDPSTDNLRALRRAFVGSEHYAPNRHTEGVLAASIFEASEAEDWLNCRLRADSLLEQNYASLYGHFGAMVCNRGDGRSDKAFFHEKVVDGTLEVIEDTGDGKDPQTAYLTISLSEVRAFLQLHGLEILSQLPVEEGGLSFDAMWVRDLKTNEEYSVYFDTTLQRSKEPPGTPEIRWTPLLGRPGFP